jgi:hypothetical protein
MDSISLSNLITHHHTLLTMVTLGFLQHLRQKSVTAGEKMRDTAHRPQPADDGPAPATDLQMP